MQTSPARRLHFPITSSIWELRFTPTLTLISMSHPSDAHLTFVFEFTVIFGTPSMMTSPNSLYRHWSASGSTMQTAFSTYGVSHVNLNKLQKVQNILSLVVLRTYNRSNTIPLLVKLHWLPIERRILFKLATLTFKWLHCGLPSNLSPDSYLHEHCSQVRMPLDSPSQDLILNLDVAHSV